MEIKTSVFITDEIKDTRSSEADDDERSFRFRVYPEDNQGVIEIDEDLNIDLRDVDKFVAKLKELKAAYKKAKAKS